MRQGRPKGTLTTFDWVGVACVAFLGACFGGLIATASDIKLTPALALLFPGIVIGVGVGMIFGRWAGVVASALLNGIAFGALLYGWNRLANQLAQRIPEWMGSLGAAMSRRSVRRKYGGG
jgi:hypothetical protein